MNLRNYIAPFGFYCCVAALCGCDHQQRTSQTHFTKADSLTESYLNLQDQMLQAWNVMIHDDNKKIKAMDNLLHELTVSNPDKIEQLKSYQERLNQLAKTRYTQKTMSNADVVEEYDFASNSLVQELIALAEAQRQFAYNSTLQRLVDEIREADQRVNNYRDEYDKIAAEYNVFIDQNKNLLKGINEDSSFEKKPLFQMVAED